MQKVVRLAICAVALGLGVNVASADVITVGLTGQVVVVNDSSLGITTGQTVTATYSYDASTPAVSSGTYQPASPPANITVSVGGQTFQSQNNWTYQVTVVPAVGQSAASFNYQAIAPASGGSSQSIDISFYDYSFGPWPSSTALPTSAPPVLNYPSGTQINVAPPNSSGFIVMVSSAALLPSLTISPASSSFIAQQNFDAVLLLSAQLSVTSMQASVGGNAIGFSYPGTCQLAQPNTAQRTALICPSAAAVLAGLGGGPVTINWLITLADGSTIQQSVIWNLVL
jgi:hypothetical protein